MHVEQLTGAAATSRTASGTVITPPSAPVGQVVECANGIKLFAGPRLDPFRNYVPYPVTTTNCLAAGTFPDYASLGPATNFFANTAVRSCVLEVPAAITGRGRVHFWAATAYYDTGHSTWVQTQRAGKPNMTTFFAFDTGSAKVADYNSTAPTIDLVGRPRHPATDPASGIWGQVRDNIAAVVQPAQPTATRPTSSHRTGLRRVGRRRASPQRHRVHPRHRRPLGPLVRHPERQGDHRGHRVQHHQDDRQPGLLLRAPTRAGPRLLPLPLPASQLTWQREHRPAPRPLG